MLYGRQLDEALEHVDGSRYALVHAVSKRARQITLWLTADPAELRAEAAPPPVAGELVTRDPVALAEAEILAGEVLVHWDPEGLGDEPAPAFGEPLDDTDTLLLESLADDDDETELSADGDITLTPALAQVLEGDAVEADDEADVDEDPAEAPAAEADDLTEVSLESMAEEEADADDDDEDAV
jgi:DNA-directed RNA polymerase subunit K/omega